MGTRLKYGPGLNEEQVAAVKALSEGKTVSTDALQKLNGKNIVVASPEEKAVLSGKIMGFFWGSVSPREERDSCQSCHAVPAASW